MNRIDREEFIWKKTKILLLIFFLAMLQGCGHSHAEVKPSNTESNIALPPKSNGEEADKEQYKPIGIQTGYCVTYRLPSQIKLGQNTLLVVGIGIEYDNRERAEGHFLITKFIDSNEATEALYEDILLIEGEESFEKKIDDTQKKLHLGKK